MLILCELYSLLNLFCSYCCWDTWAVQRCSFAPPSSPRHTAVTRNVSILKALRLDASFGYLCFQANGKNEWGKNSLHSTNQHISKYSSFTFFAHLLTWSTHSAPTALMGCGCTAIIRPLRCALTFLHTVHSWYLSWSHDGTCILRKSFLGAFLSLHMLCLTLLPVTGCSSKQDSTRLQVANICKWNHFQLQFQMRVSQQPHQPASQTFAIRTRLLWDTLHLILGGTETMFSGSLPSPQWCPSSSHSHFFRIAFFILAIYIYIHMYISVCVCVSCVFLLAIQSQIITWIALHSFSLWWSNLNARTTNPSSLMQNLKYAPYEVKSCQIPVKFPKSEVFQCHETITKQNIVLKIKASTDRSTPNPHGIHCHSSILTSISPAIFFDSLESWSSCFVTMEKLCFCLFRKAVLRKVAKRKANDRMFCNMFIQQRETHFFIQCLWSSKFIEALEMPNSWGIPMKGSEGQRRQGIAMCFRSVRISDWIAINAWVIMGPCGVALLDFAVEGIEICSLHLLLRPQFDHLPLSRFKSEHTQSRARHWQWASQKWNLPREITSLSRMPF